MVKRGRDSMGPDEFVNVEILLNPHLLIVLKFILNQKHLLKSTS